MARIPLPAPEELNDAQRKVYDKIVGGKRGRIVGPLRAALHNPELADRWQALGELLRYNTSLTPRQSELAILVTGRACGSPLEWHLHCAEARKAGIEDNVIESLLHQQAPASLSGPDLVIVRFATELNATNSVSDGTYAQAVALFGATAVVELTALVGYYTLVAMTLNAHEIPMPDGAAPAFPMPHQEAAA
ncbi:MAG TPA: carboxymuconolactone decarboxylase family protein [Candidatus Aquabacterium excrementipullorum]|nr:carboxymuconolactone decarboxylase family protein [Candidatus Aquabacterium excrementipullorum]